MPQVTVNTHPQACCQSHTLIKVLAPDVCVFWYAALPRYLMKLKEDDRACLEALHSGHLLLYHRLAPLLQKGPDTTTTTALFKLPAISTSGTP